MRRTTLVCPACAGPAVLHDAVRSPGGRRRRLCAGWPAGCWTAYENVPEAVRLTAMGMPRLPGFEEAETDRCPT